MIINLASTGKIFTSIESESLRLNYTGTRLLLVYIFTDKKIYFKLKSLRLTGHQIYTEGRGRDIKRMSLLK